MRLIFIIPLFFVGYAWGYNYTDQSEDSLISLVESTLDPTEKANQLMQLGRYYFYEEDKRELGLKTQMEALKIYPQNEYQLRAEAWDAIAGKYSYDDQKINSARSYIRGAEELEAGNINDSLRGYLYTYAGRMYYTVAMYDSAMFNYLKAKDIYEENELFDVNHGQLYHFIGSVYKRQGDMDKACRWYSDEYQFGLDHNLLDIQAEATYLMASCVETTEEELELNKRSLKLFEQLENDRMIALMHSNIAGDYSDLGEYEKALEYQLKSIRLYKKQNSKSSLVSKYSQLADFYMDLEDYSNAMKALDTCKSYTIGLEEKRYIRLKDMYYSYYSLYEKLGNYKLALNSYQLFRSYKDSATQSDYMDLILEMDVKYETAQKENEIERQKAQIKMDQTALELQEVQQEQERFWKYVLIGGLSLAVLFGFFIWSRLKITRKQKVVIESQKLEVEHQRDIVEEKNREITDSIVYAKRIQAAILPPRKLVESYLNDSFILYKPKDIVAGDFYWMEPLKLEGESGVLFAAADCTGHGVPGAMVSVICNNGLNRSVREYGLTEPGEILDKTREIVIEEFEKSEDDVKDGMDISLCALINSTTLKFAGANNPVWIIRKGANAIEEIKGNKQPIGVFDDSKPFTTHEVSLNPGDTFYIFSDGYSDQFGGENDDVKKPGGKKFKGANFKKLLLSIQHETMDKQHEILNETFENWRGSIEQVDDVCVIGVRV